MQENDKAKNGWRNNQLYNVGNGGDHMEKIKKFFAEVKAEARRTYWPNRQELLTSTGVVLIILAVSSVYLFLVDLLFSGTLGVLLQKF